MDKVDVVPRHLRQLQKALEANWEPWSEMILSGWPNLVRTFSKRRFATLSMLVVFVTKFDTGIPTAALLKGCWWHVVRATKPATGIELR